MEQQENQTYESKQTEMNFYPVYDINLQRELITLSNCPDDANSFTFWASTTESDYWGLTIKSQVYKGQTPDVAWKLTLVHWKGAMRPSKATAQYCSAPIKINNSFRIIEEFHKAIEHHAEMTKQKAIKATEIANMASQAAAALIKTKQATSTKLDVDVEAFAQWQATQSAVKSSFAGFNPPLEVPTGGVFQKQK